MSIDPIVSVESYTAIRAVPQSGGVTDVDEAARVDRTARAELAAASAAQDLSGISYLTAADREFLTYLYGPELLTDPALSVSARVGTPQFMLDLIDDRRTGALPVGTEITQQYVEGRYDTYVATTGLTPVSNPLTTRDLQAAQDYFDTRVTGAALDVQV